MIQNAKQNKYNRSIRLAHRRYQSDCCLPQWHLMKSLKAIREHETFRSFHWERFGPSPHARISKAFRTIKLLGTSSGMSFRGCECSEGFSA